VLSLAAQPTEVVKVVEDSKAEDRKVDDRQEDTGVAVGEDKAGTSSREEKFLSVFQIVKFQNGACPASDGNTGVCFTEAECEAFAGVASGSCASGWGLLCLHPIHLWGHCVPE